MITVTEHAKNILRMALASTGIENPKIRLRLNPAAPGEYASRCAEPTPIRHWYTD